MLRDRSLAEVVRHLDLVVPTPAGQRRHTTSAAVVQARDRLGPERLAWLFGSTAGGLTHTLEREEASLHCKTPERPTQEPWGLAIAYNLGRKIMADVSRKAGTVCPPASAIATPSSSSAPSGSPPGAPAPVPCPGDWTASARNWPCPFCQRADLVSSPGPSKSK
ncbi:MAG: transposase domain-containing protein [Acidiferrobacteraceae bacterium]